MHLSFISYPNVLRDTKGVPWNTVWRLLVYGVTKMFGFGMSEDFLTHMVGPVTARGALVSSVSKLKVGLRPER